MSLLHATGKVYGSHDGEPKEKVSEQQAGFRRGKGGVDQIFAIIMMVG